VKLIVIGKFIPYDKNIIDNMTLKNVTFIHHISYEELVQCYSNADLFVLSSYQEGMPRVVMESLSFGVPVIASDLPGTRTIDSSGKYVHLMKQLSASELKDLMVQETQTQENPKLF